jgi:hypothetical protein
VSHSTRTQEIDQAPGQKHVDLTVGHAVFREVSVACTLIQDVDLGAPLNRLADIRQAQDMPRRDLAPVIWIGQGQWEDAEVNQILPVNARKALGDDGFDAEIARANGGMLTARPLAIIAPADDERAGCLMAHRPLIIRGINAAEHECADGWNIAAVRQHLLARGHDFIRRDIVAELDQHWPLEAVGQWLKRRQRLDIRAFDQLHVPAHWCGWDQHLGIEEQPIQLCNAWIRHGEGAWIGDDACEGRGRRRFRAAQVDVVLGGAGTAREVARHRAHADAACGGGLPHANAAVAPGLMQARPRTDQFRQQPQLREVFQDLAGGGRQSLAMPEGE